MATRTSVFGVCAYLVIILFATGFLFACLAVLVSGYNWDQKFGSIATLLIVAGIIILASRVEVKRAD